MQTPSAFIPFVRFEDDGERVLIGTGHFDAEGQVHYAVRPAIAADVPRRTRIISPVVRHPTACLQHPPGLRSKGSSARELPRRPPRGNASGVAASGAALPVQPAYATGSAKAWS
jgi:hypothetical protein